MRTSPVVSCVPLTYAHCCGIAFCFDTSLLSGIQGAPGSSSVFPAPGLESAISPGALVPFGMVLETNTWALHVLVPVGVSLLLDTLS